MTEITHRTIEANGIRIHLAEAGEGPLVVLCHGVSRIWYSWRWQLPALAEGGFRAVAPDMRGYGQTDRPDEIEKYTLLHLVGDMMGIVEALGAGSAVIVGHDWGAPVAWHAALLRPDIFRGVVGLSVPFRPRGAARPTSVMPQTDQSLFYMLYFQPPGVAEAELERDPRRAVRRLLCSGSGDAPRWADNVAGREAVGMVPRSGGFLTRMIDPPELPAWLSEADIEFYAGVSSRRKWRKIAPRRTLKRHRLAKRHQIGPGAPRICEPVGRHDGDATKRKRRRRGIRPPAPSARETLDASVARLSGLNTDQLRLQWRNHLGGVAPAHLPRWLLLRVLAYRIQAAAFGDLDRAILRRLHEHREEAFEFEGRSSLCNPRADDTRGRRAQIRSSAGPRMERPSRAGHDPRRRVRLERLRLPQPFAGRQGDHRHELERTPPLRVEGGQDRLQQKKKRHPKTGLIARYWRVANPRRVRPRNARSFAASRNQGVSIRHLRTNRLGDTVSNSVVTWMDLVVPIGEEAVGTEIAGGLRGY